MSEGLTHADTIGNMNRIADQFQSWSEEAVKANQELEVMMRSLSSWSVVYFYELTLY